MKENNSFDALMDPGEADDFFDTADLREFEPGATMGYSRTNAVWLAEFSRLIYRREMDEMKTRPPGFRTRDQFLRPHGWRQEPDDFFNIGDTQAGLFVNAKLQCAALVFRGTLGKRSVPGLITGCAFFRYRFARLYWARRAGR